VTMNATNKIEHVINDTMESYNGTLIDHFTGAPFDNTHRSHDNISYATATNTNRYDFMTANTCRSKPIAKTSYFSNDLPHRI